MPLDTLKKLLRPGAVTEAQFDRGLLFFRLDTLISEQHKGARYDKRTYFKISIVKGKSCVHYADQSFEIEHAALVFTNPALPYQWETGGSAQSGYVCAFTEDFLKPNFSPNDFPAFRASENAVIPLDENEYQNFLQFFQKLEVEINGAYEYLGDYLKTLIVQIIHEAQKNQPAGGYVHSGQSASTRIRALFDELLERQFPDDPEGKKRWRLKLRTPAHFARQLNLHPNHLNKVLKEVTGHTTSALIANRVAAEAKTLLSLNKLTIAGVAWYLGFDEPQHFSRFFKNREGVSPKEFRRKFD
ncbi:helix-turn-helix transcriptional regulator [Mucilaginibacter sp. SMC90]|uniref:helix-turn-helix domain-containing protein n=1 Tax=Mucilaginibacter sp. SMC90 TaxID=2929803 RepID=UPI001FB3B09E|nr:helix-turn-helix transcriptional regulator [Mucilaginibacter sp. SMC90]UOE47462.1 helix-turn-helix transcriptional regulator [Mucilaginibacter sp. SMC90]